MEAFADVAVLSRIQFALTVAYHFLFVPLSIGLGLILAINETRYYRSRKPEDAAATKFWVKVFTATFAIGVATGITMEFSFGTNWANYSRFVGDIFGAPLAAEALFAFFLESVFLGVLLFGRERVSPKFYMVSSWLVWAGSCLSAPELWLTLGLFVLVYLVLLIGWARVIGRFIKEGPVAEGAAAADAAAVAVVAADAEGDVVVAEAVAAAGDSEKEGE